MERFELKPKVQSLIPNPYPLSPRSMILLTLILRTGDGNLTDSGFVIVLLSFEILVVTVGVL